jgi:hypothetical protein
MQPRSRTDLEPLFSLGANADQVTDLFLVGTAVLLVLAVALPALRQPRLP